MPTTCDWAGVRFYKHYPVSRPHDDERQRMTDRMKSVDSADSRRFQPCFFGHGHRFDFSIPHQRYSHFSLTELATVLQGSFFRAPCNGTTNPQIYSSESSSTKSHTFAGAGRKAWDVLPCTVPVQATIDRLSTEHVKTCRNRKALFNSQQAASTMPILDPTARDVQHSRMPRRADFHDLTPSTVRLC